VPRLRQTPSQTVGPFFGVGLAPRSEFQSVLADDQSAGDRIRVEGRVFDGAGNPIGDALIEVWQANAHGRYRHALDSGPAPLDPHFVGFGRAATNPRGEFVIDTIKPGAVRGPNGQWQAPHLNITLFARGMLVHAFTRMYLPDDERTGSDPVLATVTPARRWTLIAERTDRGGQVVYCWDIHLQGDSETVFFDA
jgi:protocatechuate 3,4-dioxygenase alpha subunit